MDDELKLAVEHLKRFRATFNPGEQVDQESELSADDLTLIIEALRGR